MARVRLPSLGKRKKAATPTRQVTGTSYQTTPAAGIKAPDLKEIGSQQSGFIPDPVPDVGTRVIALRNYLKMTRDDASVRVSLRAGKAPVLGADWFVDPFDDDPLNVAIAEFVDFNLFHGLMTPWGHVLEQIMTMYEAGFSVFEPVWEMREWAPKQTNSMANRKNYTMLKELAFRPALTVGEFHYDDNGKVLSVDHSAIREDGHIDQVNIPISNLLVFSMEQYGGAIESAVPILRSAYKHWIYKNRFYAIDGIQKERHSIGVPDIEILPGASSADIEIAHTLGRNLRTNEFGYIVRPSTVKVGFAAVTGNMVSPLESAEHHDNQIMKNILVGFLNIGMNLTGSGGARSVGATDLDMFLKAMRFLANSICENINLFLIPNLVAYNFQTDQFPKLKVRNIGEAKDLQMWSSAMRNLIDVGVISVDEDTENWVRAQMDMPQLSEPWVPLAERGPERITETITDQKGGDNPNPDTNGHGNHTNIPAHTGSAGRPTVGARSPSHGAGRVGLGPSEPS